MKVLVTGGAGFIGSQVGEALLLRGDGVVCVDNFNDYYDPQAKEENIKLSLGRGGFKLYRADILNFEEMKEIFAREKPDKVIHLAAKVGVRLSIKEPFSYEEVNLKGTLNMLELAKEFGIKNFIFSSSSSVYGEREEGPLSEEDKTDFPVSPYAATKKMGEVLSYAYHHLYGLKVSCLRFFTVYGPRGRPDMAPLKFTKLIDEGKEIEIYGEGTSKRDYTYVTDIVEGILAALDKDSGYEVFNLGNSRPVELNYFISLIEKELGKKAQRKYIGRQAGDVEMTFADISKSRKKLGYEPKVGIEEGIKRMVEWYKERKQNK